MLVTHDQEEAFAVADRIAVMRDGPDRPAGPVADVWAAPADPETALFLGYARVLHGAAAARLVARAPTRSPLRRSALTLDDDGPLAGRVVSARATPEQVRLVVDVDGLGEVDAVAPLDRHPAAGRRGATCRGSHPVGAYPRRRTPHRSLDSAGCTAAPTS